MFCRLDHFFSSTGVQSESFFAKNMTTLDHRLNNILLVKEGRHTN